MSQSPLFVVVNGNTFDRTSLIKSLSDVYRDQGFPFFFFPFFTFAFIPFFLFSLMNPCSHLLSLSPSLAVSGTDSADELLQLLHKTKQNVIVLLDVEAPLSKKGLFGISLVKNIVRDLNLGHVSVVGKREAVLPPLHLLFPGPQGIIVLETIASHFPFFSLFLVVQQRQRPRTIS